MRLNFFGDKKFPEELSKVADVVKTSTAIVNKRAVVWKGMLSIDLASSGKKNELLGRQCEAQVDMCAGRWAASATRRDWQLRADRSAHLFTVLRLSLWGVALT